MIVEFIGSTGTGKTTLVSEVQRRLADKVHAATSFDFITDLLGWQHLNNPTLRNLIQDIVGLPFFIRSLHQHKAFVIFALKAVTRHTKNIFFAINYLRSIVRRIGTHELFKRYKSDRIILVDEGTVLSAHLLFIYTNTVYSQQDIEKFANLVPLPELVVCINTPVDSLVQRTLQRNDSPREIRSKNQKLVEKYVSRAANMFDQLTETKEIRDRVLIVLNSASTNDECGVMADSIAKYILNYKPGVEKILKIPTGQVEPGSFDWKKHVNED